MIKSKFIIANITWNNSGWRNLYVNPKAGHRYAQKNPGHESLNFEFNKKGLDDDVYVFGHVQLRGYPQKFEEPGLIFFFTKNLSNNQNEIVGVYGNAKILNPPIKTKWKGFENDELISNIKAVKEKSMLFPISVNANRYSQRKRLVPQSGLRYISQDLAATMITDEIVILKKSGAMKKELDKLSSIFELITGKRYDDTSIEKDNDDQEQSEFENIENNRSKNEIIKELKNIGPQISELIEFKGKTYKRDNKTIAQLKILHDYKCQICGITIRKKNGGFYIEAAHIEMKSKKGPETPCNILILCPNHHKEFDYGDRKIIQQSEKQIIFKMNEKEYTINLELE